MPHAQLRQARSEPGNQGVKFGKRPLCVTTNDGSFAGNAQRRAAQHIAQSLAAKIRVHKVLILNEFTTSGNSRVAAEWKERRDSAQCRSAARSGGWWLLPKTARCDKASGQTGRGAR
jgi:hypothetical protein